MLLPSFRALLIFPIASRRPSPDAYVAGDFTELSTPSYVALSMRLSLTLLAVVTAAVVMAASRPKESARALLDERAPQWLKQHDVPSVAVAYIENEKVAWTAVYGEQSPGVPASAKTVYNVASLTKPVAAETILRLASKGA